MKRQRLFGLSVLAAAVLAIPASHMVMGKGHVPAGKDQVCHKGETLTISLAAFGAHIGHGDCELPIDDGANVFFTGDACSPDDCE